MMYTKKILCAVCLFLLLISSDLFAQHFGSTSSTVQTIFIDEGGKAYGWGSNADYFTLGIGNSTYVARTPTEVFSTLPYIFAASGGFNGIYIGIDSNLYFTGRGRLPSYYGEDTLFIPTLYPRPPGVTGWQSASIYRDVTHIALTTDGVAYYWDGKNIKDPTKVEFPLGVSKWIRVVAGDNYYLLQSSDSSLFGFGANGSGQLGNQSAQNKTTPTRVYDPIGVYKWKTMAAGTQYGYSVGIDREGRLFTWGILYVTSPFKAEIVDSTKYEPKQFTSIAETWEDVQISGVGTVVALTSNGKIYVWGGGDSILLGLGDSSRFLKVPTPMPFPEGVTKWKEINVKADAAFALDQDCRVWGWGYNDDDNSIGVPQDTGYIFPTPHIIKQFCDQGSVSKHRDVARFEVRAYPNPAVNEVNLSLQLSEQSDLKCEVLDILGRVVLPPVELKCIEGVNNLTFALRDIEPGVYFIRLASPAGYIQTVRVVLN